MPVRVGRPSTRPVAPTPAPVAPPAPVRTPADRFEPTLKQRAEAATFVAALKALVASTRLDPSGTKLEVKDHRITEAQLSAAAKTVLGSSATVDASGSIHWAPGDGAEAKARLKAVLGGLTVGAGGTLELKRDGGASLEADVKKTLGEHALISSGKVVFEGGDFASADLQAGLIARFGPDATLQPTLKLSIDEAGKAEATLKLAAMKRLKELGVEVKPDLSVHLKDGNVDRAEVGVLVSVVTGKKVDVDTGGRLVFDDGRLSGEVQAHLKRVLDGTTLDTSGSLKLNGTQPELTTSAKALFGSTGIEAGGKLTVTGADKVRVDLELSKKLGSGAKLSASGSLTVSKDSLQASLSTNLIGGASVGGMIVVSDKKKAAELKASGELGPLSGSLGVGVSREVEKYEPPPRDELRTEATKRGGVWSMRTSEVEVKAGAGGRGTVMVGPVPLVLGAHADGSVKQTVRTLSLHPNESDATGGTQSVIHPPNDADALRSMRPGEVYSDTSVRSWGFRGNAGVGFETGAAGISADAELYYQATGEVTRSFERLSGDMVRVRLQKASGHTDVKAVNASVGVSAGAVSSTAAGEALAPIVTQLAEASVRASIENAHDEESLFDFTIDLSTPQGRAALEHLLGSEVSEAQHWAERKGSGVVLNKRVETDVTAHTRGLSANLSLLTAEDLRRWAVTERASLKPDSFAVARSTEHRHSKDSWLPWRPSETNTFKFVRETRELEGGAAGLDVLPAAGGPMSARLEGHDAARERKKALPYSLLAVRSLLEDSKTSLDDARAEVARALQVMKSLGVPAETLKPLEQLQLETQADKLWLGASSLDLTGFVAPRGFSSLFAHRSEQHYLKAYLDLAGTQRDPQIWSVPGLTKEIERTLGATLVASSTGWDVMRDGARLGSLSKADLEALQLQVVEGVRERTFSLKLPATVGQWEGPPPDRLVSLNIAELNLSKPALDRAFDFSQRMAEASEAFHTLRGGSNPPEAWYERMEAVFAEMMRESGKDPIPQLALLKLAGPEHIYIRADLVLPGKAVVPTTDDEPLRLTVRHKGAAADWKTDFSELGYLHARRAPANWVEALGD